MWRFLSLAMLFAIVSSCSTLPQQDMPGPAPGAKWNLTGKLGVRAETGNANLGFTWRQSTDNFHIMFRGPFGVSVARIDGERGYAVLTEANGRRTEAADIDSLLFTQLGYRLPIIMLQSWLTGVPAKDYQYRKIENGFTQHGWRIEYQQYSDFGPRRIEVSGADVQIKLVALQWDY